MGNTQGTGTAIPPSHIKIFNDLRKIQNPNTKVQMIQTILAGPEYVTSAKRAGIYAELLNYIAQQQQQQPIRQQQEEQTIRTRQQQTYEQSNQLVTTQPKRSHIQRVEKANSEEKAIGYFQACLEVLGLEEEVALTEDTLKKAYKKATLKNQEHMLI